MLNLRSDLKEAIILLVFAGLLVDTLMGTTLLLVVLGAAAVWFKIRPGKMLRNLITLGVFFSYWMRYGKVIDPEVGLNFLTTITVLKLLEKESERDRYMIFYGLILLISAGSLFEKNLSYVLFFVLSFFILITDFYRGLRLSLRWRDFAQSLLWVLPLTAVLFFLVPRMMNPFQFQRGEPGKGEIGYTPEVNLSSIESLSMNGDVVFQAQVSRPLNSHELYWRGNTLSFTDGWNWPLMPGDRVQVEFDPLLKPDLEGIRQKVRVFTKHDFFFGLDHPRLFITPEGTAPLDHRRSLSIGRWENHLKYEVLSIINGKITSDELDRYQRLSSSLSREEKAWIQENFKSQKLAELKREVKDFFQREGFSYSLSPGRVENFLEFMTVKKVGFCSHYASALALILRQKKIPVRLVSGFLGGNYNRFGDFYLVTQNDAHVWVEAHDAGVWKRLDPTDWIVPDRITLGGEAFVNQVVSRGVLNRFGNFNIQALGEFRQWLSQWDFRFYQWLEEMDYYGQEAFLARLNLRRDLIFSLIPILLALFMGLYVWHLSRRRSELSEVQQVWLELRLQLKRKGLRLDYLSLAETKRVLFECPGVDKGKMEDLWNELVLASFADAETNLSKLKQRIREL